MIVRAKTAAEMSGVETTIEIIASPDEMVTYNTWVLPALVINGQVVARGYVPSLKKILEYMPSS